jgi:Domain of unknown function (DUF4304)
MTYSLIEVFNQMVKEYLAPYFKSKGFKKQNLNFYKEENGLTFLINFQKNSYNSVDYVRFYVNCGIYSEELMQKIGADVLPKPKEYECTFRQRFEQITGNKKQEFELLSSDEKTIRDLANEVIVELEKVLVFYQEIKTLDDFMDICIERNYLNEHIIIFKYLALNHDSKRINKYAQSISEILKDDNRLPFFQEGINDILRENGVAEMQFNANRAF